MADALGQPQQYSMQRPDEQKPQTVTFPNGTVFGVASRQQASSLAKLIVDSNNNNIKDYEQLEGTASKNLQTSQRALQVLEHLSQQQGTGEVTLFFTTGTTSLPQGSLQYQRLINFVDYLSRMSRGRKVLFVMIGSASATGSMSVNQRLSQERAQAPEPIIDQYLVNVPHQFFRFTASATCTVRSTSACKRISATRVCASSRFTKPTRFRRFEASGLPRSRHRQSLPLKSRLSARCRWCRGGRSPANRDKCVRTRFCRKLNQ